MKGLLLKDFYSLGNYKRVFLILLVIIFSASIFIDGGSSYICAVIMVYILPISSSSFNFDDSSHWDRYAISLPFSRKEIVASRYLFSLLLLACATVASFLLGALVGILKQEQNWLLPMLVTQGTLGVFYLFTNSITFPISYKLGGEKSRYFTMIILMVPILFSVLFLEKLTPVFAALPSPILTLLTILIPVVVIVAFITSYFIAVHNYSKRMF